MTVTPFAVRRVGRPVPDGARYALDFDRPCVELLSRGRVLKRLVAVSEGDARQELARLVGTGLRLLADAPVVLMTGADDE